MEAETASEASDDTEYAIQARGLTKRYGSTVAVENLDLSVPLGKVYGFLGPNGAGKTTTMRLLTTLTEPTRGSARIMGDTVESRPDVVKHIGYLPEEPPLYDELTGREQLEYIADLRGVPEEVAEERIRFLSERFGINDVIDDLISTYSKGMRRKTALIQTIIHTPEVVFLDEPTAGLDPRSARTVREIIAELVDRRTTIFLSSHILPVVDEIADTVGVLHEGELVAEGAPNQLKHKAKRGGEETLEDVFIDLTSESESGSGDAGSERRSQG
ncbi:MAG: ABC transporter ATP-binding protein [Halobacteria archaeon]|nr:ABC transporter ATP-binding protein [Halobacteria archaeon]